ncbi:hypothetical protein [Paracoccus methylarcula]|nr:hypothetical protein [Paracoccus methylarcula]
MRKELSDLPTDEMPVNLPSGPGTANALHEMFDRVGFPWRETCQDLIDRYGLICHPAFDREYCPITPCPFGLDGLLTPFSPQIFAAAFRRMALR